MFLSFEHFTYEPVEESWIANTILAIMVRIKTKSDVTRKTNESSRKAFHDFRRWACVKRRLLKKYNVRF